MVLLTILDLEDDIEAFLARHGRFAAPSQPRQETGHD